MEQYEQDDDSLDYDPYEDMEDAEQFEDEPAPAEPTPAPRRTLFYITVALIVLAGLVQLALEHRCNQQGHSALYCTLTN